MNLLIKSVEIVDKRSPHHGKKTNIHIKNGKIDAIGNRNYESRQTIDGKGMMLTTGWADMFSHFCDPGLEHKEDISTGVRAATAGGYTQVAILPNTSPVLQTKNDISYVLNRNNGVTRVLPMAAVTKGCEGEALTEMIDLHEAGAVAFSDGTSPVWHTDILLKTLQYLQKFDGLLINRPEDLRLNLYGTMHEGVTSTLLGMKGMPSLSEEIMIKRDLDLLRYAGGKIHFANISTAGAVSLIREAKREGLSVTCDVACHQMFFADEDLVDFDTFLKVNPPFRSTVDRNALIRGLKDGTIDVVTAAHLPQDEESKKLEFDLADFGIIGLQTVLPLLLSLRGKLEWADLVEKVTTSPREILGLDVPKIEVGERAELTLIDPNAKWTFDDSTNESRSKNSPWYHKELTGRVVAVFNGNNEVLYQ